MTANETASNKDKKVMKDRKEYQSYTLCVDLVVEVFYRVNRMDKLYRYDLGKIIKKDALDILYLVNSMFSVKVDERMSKFDEYFWMVNKLRLDMELAVRLHVMADKNRNVTRHILSNIDKEITKWRDYTKSYLKEKSKNR